MPIFEQILANTERRYAQRQESREAAKEKLRSGNILQANSPRQLEARLNHLQLNPGAAKAIIEKNLDIAAIPIAGRTSAADTIALERLMGGNDLVPVSFIELAYLVSKSIGRVVVRTSTGQILGYGTGFMVSPRLVMTNNHVLSGAAEAAPSMVEFNYQIGLDGKLKGLEAFPLAPGQFFLTDIDLDYTIVAVQPPETSAGPASLGWNRLIAEPGKAIIGEFLNIIQHPNGEPKQMALRENELVDVLDNFLHYQTDTAPGSSGSPVFNDQWEVVALHHSGVPQRDVDGNILSRDGKIWEDWMGEQRIDWIANEGVRISKIAQHIKDQPLTPDQERLRDEIFNLVPQKEVGISPVPSSQTIQAVMADKDAASMTWTIPLNVTVRLGGTDTVHAIPQPKRPAVTPVQMPAQPPLTILSSPEAPQIRAALEELERSGTRVYYEAEKDNQDKAEYYGDLDLNQDGTSLFNELHRLLSETHRDALEYQPSLHLYPWIDLHRDLKLQSIYSGQVFDPEHLIQEDFRISRERTVRLREILATEAFGGAERLAEELDLLEASLPYNCEHVVPQSWFQKKQPMRGDLHHLFACGSRCNSFRGNHGYFDFLDFGEALMDDCGKREQHKFEPHNGKGAVSRATLYFLLRYPGEINSDSRELDLDRLKTLITWHRQFQVSEYEKHRNLAIFAKQGNRNPLIDFPELAQKINFELGFGN